MKKGFVPEGQKLPRCTIQANYRARKAVELMELQKAATITTQIHELLWTAETQGNVLAKELARPGKDATMLAVYEYLKRNVTVQKPITRKRAATKSKTR